MPNPPAKNIVLIGMRGTGKTAVGQTLANHLGWDFIDVDHLLEKSEGKQISEIVAEHSWDHFRNLETKYTSEAAAKQNVVLATGGGVILRPENITALKKSGVIVYLTAPLEHLAARVAKGSNRPSLTGASPEQELAKVWAERKELYETAADTTVHFDFHSANKKTDLIRKSKMVLKAVRDFLES
jgi:shikimate kinase